MVKKRREGRMMSLLQEEGGASTCGCHCLSTSISIDTPTLRSQECWPPESPLELPQEDLLLPQLPSDASPPLLNQRRRQTPSSTPCQVTRSCPRPVSWLPRQQPPFTPSPASSTLSTTKPFSCSPSWVSLAWLPRSWPQCTVNSQRTEPPTSPSC